MRELAVYAASDAINDDDREFIQSEIEQLTGQIDNIIGNSKFNTIKLFKDDALSYFENSAISMVAEDKLEREKLRNAILGIMDENVAMNDIYASIFDLLEKYKAEKEQKGESLPDGAVAFDKENISLKILKINDFDLSTLEKAAANVERVNAALDRVMSYTTVKETDSVEINSALDRNIALNSAFQSVFNTFEQLAARGRDDAAQDEDQDALLDDDQAETLAAEAAKGTSLTEDVSEDILSAWTLPANLSNANRHMSLAFLNGLPKRGFVPGNIFYIQSGANENDGFKLDLGTTSVARLGLGAIDMSTRESAARGITVLDDALDSVSAQRAMVGAQINRMDHQADYLESSADILEEARSHITDTDIPKEMMTYTRLTLINQVGNFMLKQVSLMEKRSLNLLM
jgi:flagellin